MILSNIYDRTIDFVNKVDKKTRKKIGQFFTPISVARYMASLMTTSKNKIKICDAGAGSGILTASICEIILNDSQIQEVIIDLYENDPTIISLLKENLNIISQEFDKKNKRLCFNIIEDNYILKNADYWNGEISIEEENLYDIIISNPPYKKLRKQEPESISMSSIVHGQPNIYFLFMAMSAKLLKENGEMIFITPRSFTSGAYFRKFREWFFNNVRLTNLHLFISRTDVFDTDKVLQETIITKAIKTVERQDFITITESENLSISNYYEHRVPYSGIINCSNDNYFMMIPTNNEDLRTMELMNSWNETLISLGYRLKTGPVVDFRSTEFLKENEDRNTVPLFWAYNFNCQRIVYPIHKEDKPQFILNNDISKKLLVENRDYILLKRFTSKEEKRRVQSILYFSKDFDCDLIGIENHLNYIVKENGDFTNEELYGLFATLNTSFIDRYYRILNGSTQVNATEMNSLPMPNKNQIIEIGKLAIIEPVLNVEICDNIILKICNPEYLKRVI